MQQMFDMYLKRLLRNILKRISDNNIRIRTDGMIDLIVGGGMRGLGGYQRGPRDSSSPGSKAYIVGESGSGTPL